MPKFDLVKTPKGFRGFTAADQEAYAKYKEFSERLEPGEFVKVSYSQPREGWRHRKFMAMLRFAFDHWDPERSRKRKTFKGRPIEKNFDQFRKDMTILAGFATPTYEMGPKGRVRVTWEAKSIAFEEMGEEEFQKVYKAVFTVLHREVMVNYSEADFAEVLGKLETFGGNSP